MIVYYKVIHQNVCHDLNLKTVSHFCHSEMNTPSAVQDKTMQCMKCLPVATSLWLNGGV